MPVQTRASGVTVASTTGSPRSSATLPVMTHSGHSLIRMFSRRSPAPTAQDTDLHDPDNFACATITAFAADRAVTGGPRLVDTFGPEGRRAPASLAARRPELDELNDKHFLVRIGKDEVIGTELASRERQSRRPL
jgi:hypothetical protein